jgi:PhnB protein
VAVLGSEPSPRSDRALLDRRFYQDAFGAVELYRSPCAGGVGLHVNLRIWNSLVCLSQEEPRVRATQIKYSMLASPGTLGSSTCIFQVRVADGDRYGLVEDPFGHVWALTTVQEILAPAEVAARLKIPVGGK